MLQCGSCGTEDEKAFDDDHAIECVSCAEISQEIIDEEALRDHE